MVRFIFSFLFFIGSQQAFSATHCVCEIGTNKNEKVFYRLGCDLWLNKKSCDSRKIIDRKKGMSLSKYLPKLKDRDVLEIGYVGHWYDTWQTIDYVETQILPLAKIKGVYVRYDNTACNPMKDPEAVQDYLMSLNIPQQSEVRVQGNQTISIGMWDELHAGKTSFYAYASTAWVNAKFPPCETLEGKGCSAKFQAGETGRCYNRQIKRLVWLTCQKPIKGKHPFEWTRN